MRLCSYLYKAVNDSLTRRPAIDCLLLRRRDTTRLDSSLVISADINYSIELPNETTAVAMQYHHNDVVN